jgi:fumarate hydratase class II
MRGTSFRVERDPLGEVRVPAGAYYGAQTQRAVDNFPISGLTAFPELVTATILIKKAAAETNRSLGRLPKSIAGAIVQACDAILRGDLRDQFVVDVYQAGAGTSHNMNANEVLANRAAEILGAKRGDSERVHPNDHVNMGQSTNDVFPTATRLAVLFALAELLKSARDLADGLQAKSRRFARVLKTGRTHLQDAVPMTFGQEFGGYATNVAHAANELERTSEQLHELNLGATAVGTGLNAGDDFTRDAIRRLASYTKLSLRPASDRFRVTQSMGDVLAYSGAVRRLAVEVGKIASDLRLLSMGPRAGIAEVQLPPVQPGSSIMPGKVNPVIAEAVIMVGARVIGNDAAIAWAGATGSFELNVAIPVMGTSLLESIRLLANSTRLLADKTVDGLEANLERARAMAESSPSIVTPLNKLIGYENAAKIAKHSVAQGLTVREATIDLGFVERGEISLEQLDTALDVLSMTRPG